MYNILSAKEIKKKFRNALMKDVSLQAIHHIANKLGYKQKHIGGKVGYDKSVYTALTRHLNELMDYDKSMSAKPSQKALKQPQIEPNYYMMNGERDNRDYEWESVMRRHIMEAIDELDLVETTALQGDLFSGEFSDEPIKRWKKESDKKKAAERRRQTYKEKREEENNRKRIEQYNKDSERMKNGGLFGKEDFK